MGYAVRCASCLSARTRLLFVTTWVLLRYLAHHAQRSSLGGITHILIDEVHERAMLCDFLLILLRRHLDQTRQASGSSHARIVLMSATIQADRLAKYFGGAPVVTVPGACM